jgi:integrase
MAIRWDEIPHAEIRLKIYAALRKNAVARSADDSSRHILRRQLRKLDAEDHRRFIELEARDAVEHLRCIREAYCEFVEQNNCQPIKEAYWVVLRCAVFPTSIAVLAMLQVLPQPAKAIVAIAAFCGLRKGELRSLRLEDYDGSSLAVRRSAWRKHVGQPKGKRGTGFVPLIPSAASILDEYLGIQSIQGYIFQTQQGGPADLDFIVREVIRPILKISGLPWHGLHAFRRGLATNLHELGVADIVIQAILRHSDVSVTRQAYIKNDGVDARSLAAMDALESVICTKHALEPVAETGKPVIQ